MSTENGALVLSNIRCIFMAWHVTVRFRWGQGGAYCGGRMPVPTTFDQGLMSNACQQGQNAVVAFASHRPCHQGTPADNASAGNGCVSTSDQLLRRTQTPFLSGLANKQNQGPGTQEVSKAEQMPAPGFFQISKSHLQTLELWVETQRAFSCEEKGLWRTLKARSGPVGNTRKCNAGSPPTLPPTNKRFDQSPPGHGEVHGIHRQRSA